MSKDRWSWTIYLLTAQKSFEISAQPVLSTESRNFYSQHVVAVVVVVVVVAVVCYLNLFTWCTNKGPEQVKAEYRHPTEHEDAREVEKVA